MEIDAATHDSSNGSLSFTATQISPFTVLNTVINGINKPPTDDHGEGPASGEQVEIDITFNSPIFLPAGHYFFRPEVQVSVGNFLFLSAPKPITSGTAFPAGTTDLQAWIRNANLAPDWLRIGTDIIGGTLAPAFNMTFCLTGEYRSRRPDTRAGELSWQDYLCDGQEFAGHRCSPLQPWGISSVDALQDGVRVFCGP